MQTDKFSGEDDSNEHNSTARDVKVAITTAKRCEKTFPTQSSMRIKISGTVYDVTPNVRHRIAENIKFVCDPVFVDA